MQRRGAGARVCASVVAATAVTLATSALAQENRVTLSEMVVTASRNEQVLDAALPATTVITREDIERSQATDLVTLLQREAGLQRTQNGGIGTVSSVFVRGAPSLQTLVLIDGVPQNKQDASGAVSLEHLMLDNIERVEIVRGNVSAIYGSGAIGGVIQIFTRTGGREPRAHAKLETGPRATHKLSGDFSTQFDATTLSAGISRLITHGFSAINPRQYTTANPDDDGYSNTSGNFSLVHRLAAQHSFGLRFMQSDADTRFDNPFGAPTDIQSATTRLRQTSVFSDNAWQNWRSRFSLSEQSDKSRTHDNGLFGSNDGFSTRATVVSWVNSIALGEASLLTAGLEHQHQRVSVGSDSPFVTPYNRGRNADAAFAGVESTLGKASVQLNVRHDKIGGMSRNTGYSGVGYALTNRVKATLSVSSAFNAPPLGYLFSPDFGNPLLKPERARSYELGLQYAQAGHLIRANYFDTRVKDQLTFGTTTFENIERTRNDGLELSYRGVLGHSDLRASLTLQDPSNRTTGQRLTRRAATMASLGVSHTVARLRLGADLQYSGKRPDRYSDPLTFATVNTTLASYAVLDLTLSYPLMPALELNARLDNATDEKYQTVYGYNQQPRSLYVGLTWSPKL